MTSFDSLFFLNVNLSSLIMLRKLHIKLTSNIFIFCHPFYNIFQKIKKLSVSREKITFYPSLKNNVYHRYIKKDNLPIFDTYV